MNHVIRTLAACAVLLSIGCGEGMGEATLSDDPMPALETPAFTPPGLEIQGHRGCRGLLPENTVAGFVLAVREGADVLEMDLCISGDGQVIVSHEPWMSHEICSTPDGEPITEADERNHNLHAMSAERIAQYDCGARPHPRFPDQRQIPLHKPTLANVVDVINTVPPLLEGNTIRYNMEIKFKDEWVPGFCPDAATFVSTVLKEVNRLGIADRTCIQSFSSTIMEEVHTQAPGITTAWLTEVEGPVEDQLARLTFRPDIYSPYWKLLGAEDVHALQKQGIRVIPWTVNETEDLYAVMQLGVDGIITDFPDRLYDLR